MQRLVVIRSGKENYAFVNAFLLFRFYLSLEKGIALQLNNLIPFIHIWMKYSRVWRTNKQTDQSVRNCPSGFVIEGFIIFNIISLGHVGLWFSSNSVYNVGLEKKFCAKIDWKFYSISLKFENVKKITDRQAGRQVIR